MVSPVSRILHRRDGNVAGSHFSSGIPASSDIPSGSAIPAGSDVPTATDVSASFGDGSAPNAPPAVSAAAASAEEGPSGEAANPTSPLPPRSPLPDDMPGAVPVTSPCVPSPTCAASSQRKPHSCASNCSKGDANVSHSGRKGGNSPAFCTALSPGSPNIKHREKRKSLIGFDSRMRLFCHV